jgi:5-methylcytosine-specific restriction endonuclease McrA
MSRQKHWQRETFYREVFVRDQCCRFCGDKKGPFNAHHITSRDLMPNGGYVKENGITLCEPCHLIVEKAGPEQPNILYGLIGSSYKKALAESEKLSK